MPRLQVETFSYSTIGQFSQSDFQQMLNEYPVIKEQIINNCIKNPYDSDRHYFLKIIKRVPYFNSLNDEALSLIYTECEMISLDMDEQLFKFGTKCEYIYIVLQGVIQVDMTDGYLTQYLDCMGRGSIIGINGVLKGNEMAYSAKAVSSRSTYIFRITQSMI